MQASARACRRTTALAVVLGVLMSLAPGSAALGSVGVRGAPVAVSTTTAAAGSATEQRAAERALARAERLLRGVRAGASGGSGAAGAAPRDGVRGDLTLALRDLALARPALDPPGKKRAAIALSRPVTDAQVENGSVVVHYAKAQTTPEQAQATLATVTQVRDAYLAAGFRAPRTDGVAGGDTRFDVYVTDLTKTSAYGYCASDQPEPTTPTAGRADRWAFCVLDDDYVGYPGASTPTQLRQVTVAHEYFHAVQYAYDAGEDGWFMEGTAAWAEDYLFDSVDDNLQYLPFSALASPRTSLDRFEDSGFRQYGSWIFFRWLSERMPTAQGGLPTIVRDFWAAADSTRGNAPRQYSLNAVASVLKQRGMPLPQALALFADANRRPATSYAEGASYPAAPIVADLALSRRGESTSRSLRLDHLSSATTRFVPQGLRGRKTKLRIVLDMAAKKRGSVAVVSTYRTDGTVKTRQVELDGRGDGRMRVPFSSRDVAAVEVTMVNASKRFADCYAFSTKFSCYGRPLDQDVPQRVRAVVRR